jgi:hypothetical protein
MDAADARRAQARGIRHDVLLTRVVRMAASEGWDVVYDQRRRPAATAMPDLTLHRDGAVVFRYLKTEQGSLSPDQQRWLSRLDYAGLDVGVWRPRDLLSGAVHHTLHTTGSRPPDQRELALPAHDR